MKQAASWDRERAYRHTGVHFIAGLDEVGRGCWAGPLVAAAFIFINVPTDILLFDSKITSPKFRGEVELRLRSFGYRGVGEVSAQEIDTLGLQQAQYVAYERALAALPVVPEVVLLDGRPWRECQFAQEAIVDGDATVASIAAASIVAKHYRDTFMQEKMHAQYPQYGFDTHVGYGTKQHQQALRQHGVLPIHRKSFKPIAAFLTI